MDRHKILEYCLDTLEGTVLIDSWGETGIFYNPQNVLKRGIYILTIKEKDGTHDKASSLNRDHVYRVNIGLRKTTFEKLFGTIPSRPPSGGVVSMAYDFTAIDTILPHPIYAWMGWISILNPSDNTFKKLKPLIQESYQFSIEKFNKKNKTSHHASTQNNKNQGVPY